MGQHRANKQTHMCGWSKFGMDTKVTYWWKGKFHLVVIIFLNKNLKEKEKLWAITYHMHNSSKLDQVINVKEKIL